jgi:hypothetical protein
MGSVEAVLAERLASLSPEEKARLLLLPWIDVVFPATAGTSPLGPG